MSKKNGSYVYFGYSMPLDRSNKRKAIEALGNSVWAYDHPRFIRANDIVETRKGLTDKELKIFQLSLSPNVSDELAFDAFNRILRNQIH